MEIEKLGAICGRCGWLGDALYSPSEGDAWPAACPVCESEELAYYSQHAEGVAAS